MKSKLIPIKVSSYSGHKADEHPCRFIHEGRQYDINEIVDRWYQGENNPEFPAANYFRVRTTDGVVFILKHELRSDKWQLVTSK